MVQQDRLLSVQSRLTQFGGSTSSDFVDVTTELPALSDSSSAHEVLLEDACT